MLAYQPAGSVPGPRHLEGVAACGDAEICGWFRCL
jgi:hypothetical protein